MDLSPDLIVASNYRLEALLGSGSSGTVWRAMDLALGRTVALKVLRAELLRDEAQNERFRREARLLASLSHPALVTIFALITVEDEHGRVAPAIVMPFVAGRSLSDALRDDGPMEIPRAAGYLRELLEALATAHALGVVHRDLKPQNLLLEKREAPSTPGALTASPDEHIRLLDFGIARSTTVPITASSVVAARAGVMIGTPGYMSPEQIADPAHVDGRADLWGAAVCFYEMITGALPFAGETTAELVGNVLAGAWRSARQANPALPVEVDVFFGRAFHRQIAGRPKDAQQLIEALAPVVTAAERMPRAPAGSMVPSVERAPRGFLSGASTASSGPVGSATLLSGSMAAYARPGELAAALSSPSAAPVSVKTLVSATAPSSVASAPAAHSAPALSSVQGPSPSHFAGGSNPNLKVPAPSQRPEASPKPAAPPVMVRAGGSGPLALPGPVPTPAASPVPPPVVTTQPYPTQPYAPRPAPVVSSGPPLWRVALLAVAVAILLGGVGIGAFLLAAR